jgi:hypothetical protein
MNEYRMGGTCIIVDGDEKFIRLRNFGCKNLTDHLVEIIVD